MEVHPFEVGHGLSARVEGREGFADREDFVIGHGLPCLGDDHPAAAGLGPIDLADPTDPGALASG
jgi:hypothetical protein